LNKGSAFVEAEILDEIRKVRDQHAKECGYDVHRAFEQMRAETERLKEEGWQVVDRSVPRSVVREEPGSSE
jgi:hypothetical protein